VAITLLIQHWGNGGTGACIKSAKLLVSDEPVPFVGITSMSIETNSFYWTNELALAAVITPEDATNQRVTWAIRNWRGGTPAVTISLANLGSDTYEQVRDKLLGKINWQQEEYIVSENFSPNEMGFRPVYGVLAVPEESGEDSVGTVTVRATIKEGQADNDGNPADIYRDFTITIKDPPRFIYKLDGVEKDTNIWGAVDNGNISGGIMELTEDRKGYDITFAPSGGQYGNSYHFFKVDFGDGGNIGQYKGLTCHIKATGGDPLAGKSFRVKAMTEKPHRTYNPGPFISTASIAGDFSAEEAGADFDFEFYKDNSTADDKNGIYGKGVGADLSNAATDAGNAGIFTGYPKATSPDLKTARYLWVWILPWAGEGASFEITDVEFYK